MPCYANTTTTTNFFWGGPHDVDCAHNLPPPFWKSWICPCVSIPVIALLNHQKFIIVLKNVTLMNRLLIYGSEFWTMYNWPFSDLEHFYYTWFAPSYSETISLGVNVKSAIRAFRKHILYIPLLVFVHHTGLQMPKNAKKWCFYTFFICSEPSCKFSRYSTDII